MCVLIKDTGRRLPLELECSFYQGQQGDVSQSVLGYYRTRLRGVHKLTAVKRKASVYLLHPVSGTTGEGRANMFYGVGARGEGRRRSSEGEQLNLYVR